VPAFRVSVAPFLLASPTLMASLGLDLLPDRRVVSCPDKGIAPPVGRAKDLQQQGLDGIDVLEPLFQRVLVFGSALHDNQPFLSARLRITGLRQKRHHEIRFPSRVRAPGLDWFISTDAPAIGVNRGS
jgi:hypothetical protein